MDAFARRANSVRDRYKLRHADDRHDDGANNPVFLAGTLTNTGSIVVTGTTDIYAMANGTTIDNLDGATFDFQGRSFINSNSQTSTAFNNAGTLERNRRHRYRLDLLSRGRYGHDPGQLRRPFAHGGGSGPECLCGASGTVILGGTFSDALTDRAPAPSSCRASPVLERRSTSPAALCNGRICKMAET